MAKKKLKRQFTQFNRWVFENFNIRVVLQYMTIDDLYKMYLKNKKKIAELK